MNLIAKEAPLVNERDGVLVLSENAGAHEELGAFALSVNPFDLEGTADAIDEALTMPDRGARCARAEGIREQVREHDVRAWIDRPAGRSRLDRRGACAMSDSMLIVAALNGTRSRLECPKVPLTAEDLATEAKRAVDAGAGMVHVHARKKDGLPAFDLFIEDVVKAIRGKVDVPISISTQRTRSISLGTVTAHLRRAARAARPRDGRRAAARARPARRIARRRGRSSRRCERAGVRPEPVVIGVDSLGDFETLYNDSLLSEGAVHRGRARPVRRPRLRPHGRHAAQRAAAGRRLPRDRSRGSTSSMSGQDEASPIAQAVAAAAGHHVRCGFQDAADDAGRRRGDVERPARRDGRPRSPRPSAATPMEPDDVRAMLR